MKLIFPMKVPYKLILVFYRDNQTFPKYQACNVFTIYLKTTEIADFCTQMKIKVSYKLILFLLMGMIKHSQSTQIEKLELSLQYLKKERSLFVASR